MNDDDKQRYLKQLTEVVQDCMDMPDMKHGLLIVANDDTEMLSLFAINADEDVLPTLLMAASKVVCSRLDIEAGRTIN